MILHSFFLDGLLFFVAGIAGFVDTLAGGGGLLTLPALLLSGMHPAVALATNKIQASCGSVTAAHKFVQHAHLSFKSYSVGLFFSIVGAILGVIVLVHINSDHLKNYLPYILTIVLIYVVLAPKFGLEEGLAKIPSIWVWIVGGLSLGFYDGILGPATGAFWVVLLVSGLGYNLLKATMYGKIFNASSNVMALIVLMMYLHANILIGVCMALGQYVGASLAVKFAMNRGVHFIKPIFITMVSVMLVTLFWSSM